jgi:hypothetical protein
MKDYVNEKSNEYNSNNLKENLINLESNSNSNSNSYIPFHTFSSLDNEINYNNINNKFQNENENENEKEPKIYEDKYISNN